MEQQTRYMHLSAADPIVDLTLCGFGFLWGLIWSCALVPDVIRFFRKQPMKDPVSFFGIARYIADWGEHWKHKTMPWITVVLAFWCVLCTVISGFMAMIMLAQVIAQSH